MAARKKSVRKKAAKKVVKKRAVAKPRKKAAKKTARKKTAKKTGRKKARTVSARELLPSFPRAELRAPARALPPLPKAPGAASVVSRPRSNRRQLPSLLGSSGWLVAAALGAVWLVVRRAEAAPPLPSPKLPEPSTPLPPLTIEPEPEPDPQDIKPPKVIQSSGGPPGYVRLRKLSPDEGVPAAHVGQLAAIAREHLKFPMGHVEKFELGGKQYASVLEEHYHPPGGPAKPWGKHKGVSLFIKQGA